MVLDIHITYAPRTLSWEVHATELILGVVSGERTYDFIYLPVGSTSISYLTKCWLPPFRRRQQPPQVFDT